MVESCRYCMNFDNCAKDLTQAMNCSKSHYSFFNPESRANNKKSDEREGVRVVKNKKGFLDGILGDRFKFINNIVSDKKKLAYTLMIVVTGIFIISQYIDLSAVIGIAVIGGCFYIIKIVQRYKEVAKEKVKKKGK